MGESLSTIQDYSNGNGYRQVMPEEHHSFHNITPLQIDSRFAEMIEITEALQTSGSVLITGEPGSGKSTAVKDLLAIADNHSIPSLQIALHINAGKRSRIPHTLDLLNRFVEETADNPGSLLILDNTDYIAYTGKSRRHTRALAYAEKIVPAMLQAMAAPHVVALGTAHTPTWQNNHWDTKNGALKDLQTEIISAFESTLQFEGRLGVDGLKKVVASRLGGDNPLCPLVTQRLQDIHADFHIAKHVDTELLLQDAATALQMVHGGRQVRMRMQTVPVS